MTCIFYNYFSLDPIQKKKRGFLLLFLLGPRVVLVSPAAGRLCQSQSMWEGHFEQSQGQCYAQVRVKVSLTSARTSWGKGTGTVREGGSRFEQTASLLHAAACVLPTNPRRPGTS